MNVINSEINSCVRTENTQMLTVEKYSFLVAYSEKNCLIGLHMSQQYNVNNKKRKRREKTEKRGEE